MRKGKEKKENIGNIQQKKLKILLLDNEQRWHDTIEKELTSYAEEKGFEIEILHAYSPDEAINIYEKEKIKPNLIISDVSMTDIGHVSDKDGIYKFVKPLREKYEYKGKIIVVTSGEFDILVEAFKAGANYCVRKQKLEELKKAIDELEEKKK